MSKKTSLLFKSVLMILKNATIIIPLFEGLIETIYSLHHQEEQPKEIKDVEHSEVSVVGERETVESNQKTS